MKKKSDKKKQISKISLFDKKMSKSSLESSLKHNSKDCLTPNLRNKTRQKSQGNISMYQ